MKKNRTTNQDLIPFISMPHIQEEAANISTISKLISIQDEVVDLDEPIKVTTIKSKNVSVSVALKSDEGIRVPKTITQFDLIVMDAIYSLFINGCNVFTPEMVVRMISGNLHSSVTMQKKCLIAKSIEKLRHIDIKIDVTDDFISLGGELEDSEERIIKQSYLLPVDIYTTAKMANGKRVHMKNHFQTKQKDGTIEWVDIPAAYSFQSLPALYEYAGEKKEIEKFPMHILSAAEISDTSDSSIIKWYLIRRIGEIKKAKNKANYKIIYFEDLENMQGSFHEMGFFENQYKNWRDKKIKLRNMMIQVLEGFKKCSYIDDFKIIQDNLKNPIGVELVVLSKY